MYRAFSEYSPKCLFKEILLLIQQKRENNEDFFPKTVNQQNLFEYLGPISKGRLQQIK